MIKDFFLFLFFASLAFLSATLKGFFFIPSVFLWLISVSYGFSFLAYIMPKPYRKICNWGRGIAIEPLAYLAVYLLSFLSFLKDKMKTSTDTPILLIHGYFNFSSVWLFHRHCLKKKGFSSVYTINLGNPFNSIEAYAKKIEKKIGEIENRTQCKKIILIGHSMGGVVACYYALFCARPELIQKVITLSSPLKGTKLAKIAFGKCAKQIRENSPFLQKLKEKMNRFQGTTQFFHLASKVDHLVIPYSSSFFPKNPYVFVEDIGHVSLLYSKKINHIISDWLETESI